MLSSIFHNYTSTTFCNNLTKLIERYSGLSVGKADNKYSLAEEIECCLEIFLIKHNTSSANINSLATIKALAEEHLLKIIDDSKFNFVEVYVEDNFWKPNTCSFEEFRLSNFETKELTINVLNTKKHSVKDVFLHISKGNI